ncbi:MAG: flagellar export protein FliJ [Alphaproteobacteria bacterium]|nr:MAG: flagellar export protein FliJ [Alphaproteobacteria bacterium]
MADLSVLIRLHQHELDEKRRALAELYAALAELERQQRDLEREFDMEKAAVAKANDVHFTFAQYAESVIKRREELNVAEAELEEHIQKAKLSLLDTFSELKKFEMTQEERERIEDAERQFRETQELDAIGLEGFRRKGDE